MIEWYSLRITFSSVIIKYKRDVEDVFHEWQQQKPWGIDLNGYIMFPYRKRINVINSIQTGKCDVNISYMILIYQIFILASTLTKIRHITVFLPFVLMNSLQTLS